MGLEARHMRSAAECGAKAEDLERRALEGPEQMRLDWLAMAAHWRRLQAVAVIAEAALLP